MLLPGTEIHIVVFIILLFEIVIFFFQIVYFLSRPSDKKRLWFLILLFLLIYYNSSSGFLPDEDIPIPISIQNIVAYTGGLIMSMYFPFYFYKAFDLKKLKFYAYWGVLVFLFLPFVFFFLIPYIFTGNLDLSRKLVVIIPFFYALSFLYSMTKAIMSKKNENAKIESKEEIIGMYLGNLFWISLPIIVYFDGSQLLENSFANAGLLIMVVLFIRSAIRDARKEYNELLSSEQKLQEMNIDLAKKVRERTQELELANEQRANTFINLAHETKTPLILINNYLEEHIEKNTETEELRLIKRSTDKLTKDIVNFFDLERIKRGNNIYDHNKVTNFSEIIKDSIVLFKQYALKKKIVIIESIKKDIFIKADPEALDRIFNNLVENAIKYTQEGGKIIVTLNSVKDVIILSVKDNGIGIKEEFLKDIFNPYYQVNSEKRNNQGMGLGLSIVKKIVGSLSAEIMFNSNSIDNLGTEVTIRFLKYNLVENESTLEFTASETKYIDVEELNIKEEVFDIRKYTIMLVEDNVPLLNYLVNKLSEKFNVFYAINGSEAFEKIITLQNLDLIVSDVMMNNGNGFDFYKNVSSQKKFNHIPFIFLTAKIDVNDKMNALSMGAIDYMYKPFMIDELSNKIESILQKLADNRNAIIELAYNNLLNKRELEPTNIEVKNLFEEKLLQFKLTSRETDIVRLLVKGNSSKVIADTLFRSEHTIAKHIQNIYEKVKVKGRVELLNKLGINSEM